MFWAFLHIRKSSLRYLETWDMTMSENIHDVWHFSKISPRVFNWFYFRDVFERNSATYTWIPYIDSKLWKKSQKTITQKRDTCTETCTNIRTYRRTDRHTQYLYITMIYILLLLCRHTYSFHSVSYNNL